MEYDQLSKTESSTNAFREEKIDFTHVKVPLSDFVETLRRLDFLEEKLEQKDQIIPIQFLESGQLDLKRPISVSLSYSSEDKIWVVDCPELNLYSQGRDEQEAIKDFKVVLEEFYFSLKKDKDKLGLNLENKWTILNQIIQEK